MSWIDTMHRRSEEEAERLQKEEIDKIINFRNQFGLQLSKANYEDICNRDIEFEILYLSTKTSYTGYSCDKYRLCELKKVKGYIFRLFIDADCFKQNNNNLPANKYIIVPKSDFRKSDLYFLYSLLDFDTIFYRTPYATFYNKLICNFEYVAFSIQYEYSKIRNPLYDRDRIRRKEYYKSYKFDIVGYYQKSEDADVEIYFVVDADIENINMWYDQKKNMYGTLYFNL